MRQQERGKELILPLDLKSLVGCESRISTPADEISCKVLDSFYSEKVAQTRFWPCLLTNICLDSRRSMYSKNTFDLWNGRFILSAPPLLSENFSNSVNELFYNLIYKKTLPSLDKHTKTSFFYLNCGLDLDLDGCLTDSKARHCMVKYIQSHWDIDLILFVSAETVRAHPLNAHSFFTSGLS